MAQFACVCVCVRQVKERDTTGVDVCGYVFVSLCVCICQSVFVCVCVCMRVFVYTYVCIYACQCVCVKESYRGFTSFIATKTFSGRPPFSSTKQTKNYPELGTSINSDETPLQKILTWQRPGCLAALYSS